MTDQTVDPTELLRRLEAFDRKLDLVLERQRFVEDLISEMTPVVREVLRSSQGTLSELEAKGYFAVGKELLDAVDRFVTTTTPEEVRELSGNLGGALRTLRHLTAPDVLQVADEATEVLQHADSVEPVGMVGVVRATSDKDVQRGLGVALEVLRHLGRHPSVAPAGAAPAPRPAPPPAPTPVASPAPAAPTRAAHTETAPVVWEGRTFDAHGFLVDPSTWDEALAAKMAGALGLTLSEEHWLVVRWARADWVATGSSPNVRRVASGSGVGTRRMYELFPKTPGKTAALLAGIPKPAGCV